VDFSFHVPLFCTAAGAVAEIQTVCLVNIEFCERKKLILNQVKRASHFIKIIVVCPHHLPKLPESTQCKQAIPNKGSLFNSHCAFLLLLEQKSDDKMFNSHKLPN
jgi:hypothetical protein